MATAKLAKVDLLVVLAILLTVILALRLGVKIARSIETRNKNATNGWDNNGFERKRTEEKYRCHDGYVGDYGGSNDPKYPFFYYWFYNEISSKAISTAQKVIEQELEWYVAALENSASILSKEDQTEQDIVISCVESVSKKTKVNLY